MIIHVKAIDIENGIRDVAAPTAIHGRCCALAHAIRRTCSLGESLVACSYGKIRINGGSVITNGQTAGFLRRFDTHVSSPFINQKPEPCSIDIGEIDCGCPPDGAE